MKNFVFFLLLLFIFYSCASSPYPSCPMTEQIIKNCKAETHSCAIEDHPQCEKGICLIYKHENLLTKEKFLSSPFCTYTCNNDNECEGETKCKDYIDKKVCVPLKYLKGLE